MTGLPLAGAWKTALVAAALLLTACHTRKPTSQAVPATNAPAPAAAKYYVADGPSDAPGPCTACGRVVLTYIDGPGSGAIDDGYVRDLARQLVEIYGLDVTVRSPLTVSSATFDSQRKQYDGDAILTQLESTLRTAAGEPRTTYLAIMNEDLFLSFKPEWRWAFAGRRAYEGGDAFAVISAHRMAGAPARRRMLVMVGKYIGAMACGFSTTDDRSSIMFNNVLSAKDLDGMDSIACYRAEE